MKNTEKSNSLNNKLATTGLMVLGVLGSPKESYSEPIDLSKNNTIEQVNDIIQNTSNTFQEHTADNNPVIEEIDSTQIEFNNLLKNFESESKEMEIFMRKVKFDEKYVKQFLEYAKKDQNDTLLASAYYYRGRNFRNQQDYYNAVKEFEKSLNYKENIEKRNIILYIYIGMCQDLQLMSEKALESYDQAFIIAQKSNQEIKDIYIPNILANKAYIYAKIGNYEDAITTNKKALEYNQKTVETIDQNKNISEDKKIEQINKLKIQEASIEVNLSSVYTETKEFKNASLYINKALDIYEHSENIIGVIDCFEVLFGIEEGKKEYDKALNITQKTMDLVEKHNAEKKYGRTFANRGTAYFHLGEYKKSVEDLNKALQSNLYDEDKLEVLKILSDSYHAQGKHKKRGETQDSILSLNKEINENTSKTKGKLIRDLEKDKTKIEQQRADEAIENVKSVDSLKSVIELFSTLSTVIVGIVAAIGFYLRRKTKKEKVEIDSFNRLKNRIQSRVTHDIKKPITDIESDISFLRKIKDNPSLLDKQITQIEHSINNMRNVTNSSLKLIEESMQFEPEKYNINEAISEVIETNQGGLLEKKNIHIKFDNTTNTDHYIFDKSMILIICENLLSNAIKFTPKDGFIEIFVEKGKKELKISFKNTGKGISEENIQKILDINTYYTTKDTENKNGTGLGIMLVQSFVKEHGGKLSIKSRFGKSTTFTTTIPQ